MKKLFGPVLLCILLVSCNSGEGGGTSLVNQEGAQDIVTLEAYVEVASDVKVLRSELDAFLVVIDELQTTNNYLKDENLVIKDQMSYMSDRLDHLNSIALEIDDYVTLQNDMTLLQIQMHLLEEDLASAIDTGRLEVAQSVLYVDNALDLLNAMESNTHIVLSEGDYNLSTVDYKLVSSSHMYVTEVYDGEQIEFKGLRNVTIEGAGLDETVIMVEPRYANVFTFDNCSELRFNNLTMGHTIEQGSCVGGVVSFTKSQAMTFDKTRLYGCGTYGLVADGLFDLSFNNSVIDGCSYGIMQVHNSKDLNFTNSTFRDNESYDLITLGGSQNIYIDQCEFINNFTDYDAMFIAYASRNIIVEDSVFLDNSAPSLTTEEANIQFVNCEIPEGQFGKDFMGQ